MSAILVSPSTATGIMASTGSAVAAGAPSSTSSAAGAGSSAAAAAGAAAGGGGWGQGESTGMDTNERIVFWLDIALLCAVALFFLAALPRAIARFSRRSEWGRGLLMYGGAKSLPALAGNPSERFRRQQTDATQWDYTTEQSHTLVGTQEKGWKGETKVARNASPPPHVPAWPSILYPVSAIFAYNVAPGKSVGKLTLALLFIVAVIVLQFVLDGNPLTKSVRLGWTATGLIPVTIAFATKNNLVGMFVGMGYERLNFIHRWIGIVSFVAANVHAMGFLYKWSLNGQLSEEFQKPFVIHGAIALAGIELLFFASLSWIRNKAYTFFMFSHVAGYCLYLVALCFHRDVCVKWVLVAAFIYAFDHLLRLVKTRISVARMKVIPELGLVRLEIPTVNRGWRAGQHVRLRVLSSELGFLGWTIAHPFTVANAPGSDSADKKGMTLLVKKCGKWTGKLYDAAGRAGYYPTESGYGTVREMRVIVEGPYGGLGNMVMAGYSSAMLVGGGSGVTFVLSQAEELVQAVRAGTSSLRFIELVWITQDQASITPLLSSFSALIDSISTLPGILFKISIYYSRASPSSPSSRSSPSSESTQTYLSTLAPTLSVHSGRPALNRILDGLVKLTAALGPGRARGVAVGVCGPLELVGDVRKCVWSVEGDARRKSGGVELHEEVFGW
ncbi:hypothetical protein ACEPAG_9018 [Sanghuangporus baumii]